MRKDLVSCIIPTYKRSDSLTRAINSVLNQTYRNVEVIVVDDNDPNDKYSLSVQKVLKKITDSRVRYIQQKRHSNGAVARNVGIEEAQGEYIAFLDDDDEWLENKLELQIEKLKKYPEYGGISCLYTYYKDGIPVRKCPPYTSDDLYKKVLDRSVAVCTPTLVFKRKFLDKTSYFDESLIRHQDLQLLLDFLSKNKLLVLQKYLVLIHTEIGGNRPDLNRLIKIKAHFFTKMSRHFNNVDRKTRKRAYAAHYFEIIYLAAKEKNIKYVVKYLAKIGLNPFAYYDVFKRYYERKKYSL